jgi:hypothetical protein
MRGDIGKSTPHCRQATEISFSNLSMFSPDPTMQFPAPSLVVVCRLGGRLDPSPSSMFVFSFSRVSASLFSLTTSASPCTSSIPGVHPPFLRFLRLAQRLSKGTTTSLLSPWCVRASALGDKTSLRFFATPFLGFALFFHTRGSTSRVRTFFSHPRLYF